MLTRIVRKVVAALLPDVLTEHLGGLYKLDPKAQYMLVVKDDATAQQLVKAINDHLDPSSRIIVLAAESVSLVEINKGGK